MEREILVKRIGARDLTALLRGMHVGDELRISEKEFRVQSVHNACHRLRKATGRAYTCSARRDMDGCWVRRTA